MCKEGESDSCTDPGLLRQYLGGGGRRGGGQEGLEGLALRHHDGGAGHGRHGGQQRGARHAAAQTGD